MNLNGQKKHGLGIKRNDLALGEEIHSATISGLKVYVLPKADFSRKYAEIFVRYGSNDNIFVPGGKDVAVEVPPGIAHFLEHKMFEKNWGDAFGAFAKFGASANAYTGNNYTSYLYWTLENFEESLDLLMDIVFSPYFTEKSVEKEKGIIGQEIRMYNDHPGSRLMRESMEGLYINHPVRIDIAGTVESINEIDENLLYLCHENFYSQHNMSLFVAGDVNPGAIFDLVDDLSKKYFSEKEGVKSRIRPQEPQKVLAHKEINMFVPTPLVQIGWKGTPIGQSGKHLVLQEISSSMLMDILFGRSSSFYTEVYEEGLMDDLSYSYEVWPDYAHGILTAQSEHPEELSERVWEQVEMRKRKGILPEELERVKTQGLGRYIRLFDSPDALGETEVHLEDIGESLFSYKKILEGIESADLEERLSSLCQDLSQRTIVRKS